MESNGIFPLMNAKSITISNDSPDAIDLIFFMVVNTPGFPEGMLYPVVCWEHEEHKGVWFIKALDGFTHIPHIIQRLKSKENDASSTGDSGDILAAGMMEKNDYTWDSIVRATRMSTYWADHVNWAIQECFAQSTVVFWNDYPSLPDEAAQIITFITTKMNTEQREQIIPLLKNYMVAYSGYNHHRMANYKSNNKLETATAMYEAARNSLVDSLSTHPHWGENEAMVDDNGVEYLPRPKNVV